MCPVVKEKFSTVMIWDPLLVEYENHELRRLLEQKCQDGMLTYWEHPDRKIFYWRQESRTGKIIVMLLIENCQSQR